MKNEQLPIEHDFVCEHGGCSAPATTDDRGFRLVGQVFFAAFCDEHAPKLDRTDHTE